MQKSFRFQSGLLVVACLMLPQCWMGSSLADREKARITNVDESSSPEQIRSRSIQLVIQDELLAAIRDKIPPEFKVTGKGEIDTAKLDRAVSEGDSLVWIGTESGLPGDLWVGAFKPSSAPLRVTLSEHSPLVLKPLPFRASNISSGYIHPPKDMVFHNVDEEPFADFLPILEARDRFGQVVGYPGVLFRHNAPSTVRRRFRGAECFFFFFDRPLDALDSQSWVNLLEVISQRFLAGLQIRHVETGYASYRLGERIEVRVKVANQRSHAAAVDVHVYAKAPGQDKYRSISNFRRSPDAFSDSEVKCDFVPNRTSGLWMIRIEGWQDLNYAEELAAGGHPVLVDRRDIGVVVLNDPLTTPSIVGTAGAEIRVDRQSGFWTGTNYYPSSSWWDWLWSDFRPLQADEDFAAMRKIGYRLVRIWSDPILNESSMRALDSALFLASQHGLVVDICLFTQWTRWMGFEQASGGQLTFDFRGDRNFNVYGISFLNMNLQRQYVRILARRWRNVGNLVYDLSNETYVKDPDDSQMDNEVRNWKGIPRERGVWRDTLLFHGWARNMTSAIRQAGGTQPVIHGSLFFKLGGGDPFVGNRDGDIATVHSYGSPESTGVALASEDPSCSSQPILLEEFGTNKWNAPDYYDATAHYALSAGAAGALSYEWGVRWLEPELSFYATPLRDALDPEPDPRWFSPVLSLAKDWPRQSAGLFPAPSGFIYGSVYSGTPFPASAAVALGHLGLLTSKFGRAVRPEKVYLFVPTPFGQSESNTNEVELAIQKLWQARVAFGVVREDCLARLPASARILICPVSPNPELRNNSGGFHRSNLRVYVGDPSQWLKAIEAYQIPVAPRGGINLLVRRTPEGALYSLYRNSSNSDQVAMKTEGHAEISLGLNDFALIHEQPMGIDLVQATNEVVLNGTHICTIKGGRALLSSSDGKDLASSESLRMIVNQPSWIQFQHRIRSISFFEGGGTKPVASYAPSGSNKEINIDDQMARYIIQIQFEK